MIQHFLSHLNAPLTVLRSLSITITRTRHSPPSNNLPPTSHLELNLPTPLPLHIRRTRMIRKRPHQMHSTHFGLSIPRTHAPARRASEFGEQGIQDLGIAALELGEDVDVHFLEHVQGREDVVVECEQ